MNLLSYLLATETWHIRLLNRPVSTYELNGSTTASRSRPVMGMSEAWICCSSNKGRSQRSSRFRQLITSYWRRSTLTSDGLLTAQSSMPNTLTIEKLVAKHFTVSRQDNQLSSCLSVQHTHARMHAHTHAHTHTHTHTFNDPLSGTIWVSRYEKGKTNLDFTEARDSEWQWHQLGHMQICISLQTDNHASTPTLSFLHAGCLMPNQHQSNEGKVVYQSSNI